MEKKYILIIFLSPAALSKCLMSKENSRMFIKLDHKNVKPFQGLGEKSITLFLGGKIPGTNVAAISFKYQNLCDVTSII